MSDQIFSWEAFFFGVLCSFVASFLFIFFILIFLRPKIKISPDIAKTVDTFENNKACYSFKILNKSWFSAYEINIELNELISIPVDGGINFRYTKLALKTNKSSHLAPYRPHWMKKNYGKNALQLRAYDNISEILSLPLKSVQIEVTLRHGLTGLSRVYRMDYSVEGKIKQGQFVFGNEFAIV